MASSEHKCVPMSPICPQDNRDVIEATFASRPTRRIKRKEHIFLQGDENNGVYFIKSGLIALNKLDARGNLAIVRLMKENTILGSRSFFAEEAHSVTATALTDAEVTHLPQATFKTFLEERPHLTLFFTRHLARELRTADEAFLRSTSQNLIARLSHLILMLRDEFLKEQEAAGTTFDLPLSRRELAEMLGATPESLSRAIKRIEERNLIIFKGRTVTIPSMIDLQTMLQKSGRI